VQFGVVLFPTAYSINVVELGKAIEAHGFESLWFPEHTHTPASRRTPWPGGAELPREYSNALDPFVALAGVAATTSRLRLGTGVCLVVERDPITLAKEVSTLDQLSGGRFLLGVGGGWNREEMENHGTAPVQRWKILRERILAMKRIWTEDEAEFHGEFVSFDPIWQWPKPAQKPHPPIVVGGNGPHTLERVLEYGDEWMPSLSWAGLPIEERIGELQRLARAAGRGSIPVSIFGVPRDPRAIERYAASQVSRCIFWLPTAGADETLPLLAECAAIMKSFL
jgi:probable F420-dependent oxidoreductase